MTFSLQVINTCRRLEPHRFSPAKVVRSLRHLPYLYRYGSTLSLRSMSKSTWKTSEEIKAEEKDDVFFYVIEDAEYMGRYCPGGYHPVRIGDRWHDRYRVIDKLGHGSYSTVWLARDERLGRLVAIKVCTADATQRESEILSLLNKRSSSINSNDSVMMAGRDLIPLLRDTFRLYGPHGSHNCLVMDVSRANLAEARRRSCDQPMPLQVARAMVVQLLLAVAYLHGNEYVHGDLHTGNILLRHPEKLNHLSDDELHNKFGETEYEAVQTFDNKLIPYNVPTSAILPLYFPAKTEEFSLSDAHILLSDLGEAYQPSERRIECNSPVHCRPPENFFEPLQPRSFPSDIWTLACSLWGILGSLPIFEALMETEDSTAARQVELLGKFPPEWWARWERRSEYCAEDGEVFENRRALNGWDSHFEFSIQKWRRNLGMELVSSEEKEALLEMLNSMLKYKPEERYTISQVLQSKWVREWAMPDYEKLPELQPSVTARSVEA